jgi:hypothetical protein
MKWTHSARWLVAAGLCATGLFTACSDGDAVSEPNNNTGGTEASAGDGNDKGGSSSTAGTKSEAGESTGGTKGTGTAGDGPGPIGGDGNATGGQPGAPSVAMCQEACADDKDCLDGFECQDSRCVSTAEPMTCTSDSLCQAQLSGWTTECNEQSDCLVTQVCVDVGETMGRCATKAGGVVSCETLQQDEVETKDFEGEDVTVCGNARAECGDNGACFARCAEDSCPENFACNATSGACECDNDKACEGVPNASKCVMGQCVCADDGDCTVNANKCNDGVCGCGDASVCDQSAAHPGTSWVCE